MLWYKQTSATVREVGLDNERYHSTAFHFCDNMDIFLCIGTEKICHNFTVNAAIVGYSPIEPEIINANIALTRLYWGLSVQCLNRSLSANILNRFRPVHHGYLPISLLYAFRIRVLEYCLPCTTYAPSFPGGVDIDWSFLFALIASCRW